MKPAPRQQAIKRDQWLPHYNNTDNWTTQNTWHITNCI